MTSNGIFLMEEADIVLLSGESGWVNVGPWAIKIEHFPGGKETQGELHIEVNPRTNEHKATLFSSVLYEAECLRMGGVDPDEGEDEDE